MRILLVDDDELDRLAVRRCLQQAGIAATVDEVASGSEALALVRPDAYDCVLLDYVLPGADTIALTQLFGTTARDTPVVILTGYGDEDVAVEFMKAGAADYLPKASLSPERLATSFRYALEVAQNAAARREAENALREREAEFRTLANGISQLAWMGDTKGRRYWCNQRWQEFTGLRPDESVGLGWHLALHPQERATVLATQQAKLEQGQMWEETVRLRRRDGEYRWFLSRGMPVRDDAGEILRWVGTDTDITERIEGELERERLLSLEQAARADAVRAVRARDDVVAFVAHDLRNPLQSIAMAADVLATHEDAQCRRTAAVIERAVDEMERLISDLLDVSRLEAGSLSIKQERVDVNGLVTDALELFAEQARAGRIALAADIPSEIPAVHVDRVRVIQVLSNLLANALKFTPEGGRIEVSAVPVAEGVRITVSDSGSGIPPANLPHIFDRFWQASHASRSGAGLGLAICKGIVEAHGGHIAATSTDRGACIHVTMPQSPEWERTED